MKPILNINKYFIKKNFLKTLLFLAKSLAGLCRVKPRWSEEEWRILLPSGGSHRNSECGTSNGDQRTDSENYRWAQGDIRWAVRLTTGPLQGQRPHLLLVPLGMGQHGDLFFGMAIIYTLTWGNFSSSNVEKRWQCKVSSMQNTSAGLLTISGGSLRYLGLNRAVPWMLSTIGCPIPWNGVPGRHSGRSTMCDSWSFTKRGLRFVKGLFSKGRMAMQRDWLLMRWPNTGQRCLASLLIWTTALSNRFAILLKV